MDYVFDRAEEEFAVLTSLEDDSVINIALTELENAREGDIIRLDEEGVRVLKPESEARRLSLAERFNRLKNKD
ncbi:MAG: DUF3006 domain-containing protein [Clostridia bacterium]|nr:DUF3006 domain-containing protein [Clostridia bacterium]